MFICPRRVSPLLLPLLLGCGASNEEARQAGTTPAGREIAEEGPTSDPNAIPAEKFEEIDRLFKRKAAQLQFNCYNEVVEKTKVKYEGKLSLSVIVGPGGRVSQVKVVGSSLKSPAIEECVIAEINKWEWPDVPAPAPYSGTVTFKPAW